MEIDDDEKLDIKCSKFKRTTKNSIRAFSSKYRCPGPSKLCSICNFTDRTKQSTSSNSHSTDDDKCPKCGNSVAFTSKLSVQKKRIRLSTLKTTTFCYVLLFLFFETQVRLERLH